MKDEFRPSPRRANRGGSWWRDAEAAHVVFRRAYGPPFRYGSLGLRLVRRAS